MVTLHPQILEKDGEKQFVVLTYREFLTIQEELESYYDLLDLREAKEAEKDAPTFSLTEARKELGLS